MTPHEDDPIALVRRGYDLLSHVYRGDSARGAMGYGPWLRQLARAVPKGRRVLDVGCGCGRPVAAALTKRFRVTGLDLSPVQVARARRLVPEARFLLGDMTQAELPRQHYGAIVALYSIIHVPVEDQPDLLLKMQQWLEPDGLLLASVGASWREETVQNWLGVRGARMWWSHADAATYLRWLEEAGLDLIWAQFVTEAEEEHLVFLARAVPEVEVEYVRVSTTPRPEQTAPAASATAAGEEDIALVRAYPVPAIPAA